MADRRGIIVPLIILTFIFLSPDPARSPQRGRFDPRPTIDDAIAEEQHSLSVLQNSTYSELRFEKNDDIGLNLTGLEPERGYSWAALRQVQGKAQRWLGYAGGDYGAEGLELDMPEENLPPLYKNVTGFVHGEWVRSKLDESVPTPQLNLSQYAPLGPFGPLPPRNFRRNITGDGGDIRLRFHENERPLPAWLGVVPCNTTTIDVEMTISDVMSLEEYEMRLIGVYFPTVGQAMLTTTSDKFAGIFMLPHLAMSNAMFDASRTVLNESISRTIQRQIDRDTERLNPWAPTIEGAAESPFSSPECEMVVYLQQLAPALPNGAVTQSKVLSFLERELRFPTGAFLPLAPDLKFAMAAFSPDCGFVIESKGPPDYVPQEGDHLLGPKLEVLHNSSRRHLMFFTLTLALQLILLMRQMREASTPSTRSRISFYTIAMLALGDGFTTMTFLLISLFIGTMWINLVGTAFLAFISVSFFGMRFLLDIWTVQAPERARRAREEAEEERRREERFQAELQRLREQRLARLAQIAEANTTADANNEANPANVTDETTTQANTTETVPATEPNAPPTPAAHPPAEQPPPGSLPLPVTAQRPTDTGATPVFMPSDQEGLEPITEPNATTQIPVGTVGAGQSFGALYTRFYLLLLLTLFLSLNATSWAAPLRRVYFTGLGLVYLSFWIPQLNRNVQRNCRKALNWEYVFGQSFLRLLPFAYFYAYSNNVLFAEVDYIGLSLLIIWVWIQVILLVSQEIVGPRWFVRKDWAPPAYDYHPVLRADEEGATLPIGFSQATAAGSAPSSPVVERDGKSSPTLARRASTTTKESKEKGKRIFDCAICMQDLEVAVIEAGSSGDQTSGPAGLLARRTYMVTPCRHIFHSACLEGWMKYRLQCPICRETLPPL